MKSLFSAFFITALLLGAVVPAVSFAQFVDDGTSTSTGTGDPGNSTSTATGVQLVNPLKVDSIEEFLVAVIQFLVRIGAIVVVVMLMIVGAMFVFARGNPEKISQARTALIWTLVGAVILLGAETIAQVIQATIENIRSTS